MSCQLNREKIKARTQQMFPPKTFASFKVGPVFWIYNFFFKDPTLSSKIIDDIFNKNNFEIQKKYLNFGG